MEHKERTRTSISPLGLNKSTPDNVVEDGALEVCHNLRFANGAWRNVQEFLQKNAPSTLQGKDILYAHIANGKPNYITKDTKSVTTEKVKYYGMRSQAIAAIAPRGGESYPNPTTDFVVTGKANIDVLQPISTTYYLNAPLSVARTNPNSVTLFDKNQARLGTVARYDNGRLYFYDEENLNFRDGDLELFYSEVMYAKLGEYLNDTFYFIDQDISAEGSCKAVFIKRGENYIYYGSITNADKETNSYAIYEQSSGITIACVINSLKSTVIRFKRTIEGENDSWFHNAYEEYAMFMRGVDGTVGYFTGTSNEGNVLPKFSYDEAGNKVFVYYDPTTGSEAKFKRQISADKIESDEEYLARYKNLPIEDQIWVFEVTPCANYVTEEGGNCLLNLYSDDFVDVEPMAYIPFFYSEKAFDIIGEETSIYSTLSAYNSAGFQLCTFGEFGSNVAIDHFGNMLIVRDLERHTTHYYVFSDGTYKLYGNAGETYLSFEVSIKDKIHSPKMTDVPMFYKAPFVSASDGSTDGRACLAAAERIAPLKSFNSNSGLLISESDGYFRGEFAMFVVARAKDGTEVYRTTPQVLRSETLLGGDSQVFVFCPETEEDRRILDGERNEDDMKKASYIAEGTFPYYYLVWARQRLDHAFTAGEKGQAYNRYIAWRDRYKNRYARKIQPLLDSVTASDLYKLKVEIDSKGNNIHELAIYSTRLYPLFEIGTGYVKTNPIDCLNQPFYEMKVLSGDTTEYTITADDFTAIETKTDKVYIPTQSGENDFFATKSMEYNNCLHSFGIELFQPPINGKEYNGDGSDIISDIVLSRTYDGAAYYARYGVEDFFKGDALNYKGLASKQPYLLAYADRISKVLFGKYSDAFIAIDAVGSFAPEYSSSLNISYITNKEENTYDSSAAGFMRPNIKWDANNYTYSTFSKEINEKSRSSAKYRVINIANLDSPEQVPLSPTYPIKVGNRVQVSETNNPLSNPYNRSYRIGTINNEIIAINSAAIEMSDAKFGEFPLYVFTTEGIFAMQSGTESLYSAVIPIAKDVAINPNTLAVNGAVLFFTDKGLHMLSQNGVQLISAGLHEDDNRIPEWMYSCRMVHLPEYNEVMCLLMDGDETTGKAYVFSLDNNYWSERDVPSGYTLNNNEVFGESSIHNLENEGESVAATIELETRPIKLGANKELKRLETLIVRFEADKDEPLEVTIKGSVDGVEYKDLRKVSATTNTDVLIRRTPASVKYLKFVVKSSDLQSSIRLIRFDTEHYLRFVRKMR